MSATAKVWSVDALAKRLKKSARAVRRQIDSGAIRSIAWVDGKPKVTDLDAAAREFLESVRPRETANGTSLYHAARTDLQREQAEMAKLKREAAELELAERKRELIPAAEVRAALAAEYAAVKAKLAAIPTRARAEIPHLTAADVSRLQEMVDEALAELADEDVAAGAAA